MNNKKKRIEEQNKKLTQQQRRDIARNEDRDEVVLTAEEKVMVAKKRRGLLILAGVLAIALIFVAIFVPVYYSSNYLYEDNPIVEIRLSNGMTLKYKIYAEDTPRVANNFLFLAEMGYFDGNVIHDNSNSWVRFGGYYIDEEDTSDLSHRTADTDFIAKTSSYFSDHSGEKTQYKYQLNRDTTAIATKDDAIAKYGLFGQYSAYSNDYSILGKVGAQSVITDTSYITTTIDPIYMGKAYDESTEANIEAILAMGKTDEYYRDAFQLPVDNEIITIKKVKIFNYEPVYGDNYEDYLEDNSYISSAWSGSYI